MSFGDGPFQDFKLPLVWIAGASVLVAAVVAAVLLLGDRRETLRD